MTKITYTSTNVDLEVFHHAFDAALAGVRAAAGGEHPNIIGGEPVMSPGAPLVDVTPIDTSVVLGHFAAARTAEVDRAVTAARAAQPDWARTPWRRRVDTLRRAAALIRERKFALAALMSLEVGKNRLEAMGDAEESADLIDYYCQQLEDANGFVREMAKVTPDRAQHRRAATLRSVRLHRPLQFPARPVDRHVRRGARRRQRGGLQAVRGHALDRPEAVRDIPRRRAAGRVCFTSSWAAAK